jgi:hypothetical protein
LNECHAILLSVVVADLFQVDFISGNDGTDQEVIGGTPPDTSLIDTACKLIDNIHKCMNCCLAGLEEVPTEFRLESFI